MNCLISNCKYNNKPCYGNYCYKHRSLYLLKNNFINFDNFTGNIKDYLKKDIIYVLTKVASGMSHTLNKFTGEFNVIPYSVNSNGFFHPYQRKYLIKIKKEILFDDLKIMINNYNYFLKNINHIIYIQGYLRKRAQLKLIMLKGPGFINKSECKNDEDFLFMTSTYEIEDDYFFSYKDNLDNIWFFDIRSFNKLIQVNQKNPYTREDIPYDVKSKANKLINILKKQNKPILPDEFKPEDEYQILKQLTVDIFTQISLVYPIEINWLLNLNIHKLKKLYRSLEDIWNYRAQLSPEIKSRIAPPNGDLFIYSINIIDTITIKNELLSIILNEIKKINNAIDNNDKQLGYMYFKIGLGEVSKECFETNSWLQYV